jgi:hypothetical protein
MLFHFRNKAASSFFFFYFYFRTEEAGTADKACIEQNADLFKNFS